MRQFGADFELPDVMPDESTLRAQYLIPALTAVLKRRMDFGTGTVTAPELPKGIERAEVIRGFDELLPEARFTVAWAYINCGTEDEPDWQLRHIGRIDVVLEKSERIKQ